MKFRTDQFGHAYAGAGYGNVPTRVPFVELVEPTHYVGEEIFRFGNAGVRAATRAAGAFNRWRNRRATFKALSALEDFRLEDIGVRREDIAKIADDLANG